MRESVLRTRYDQALVFAAALAAGAAVSSPVLSADVINAGPPPLLYETPSAFFIALPDLTAALTTAAGAVQAMGKDLQTTASQLESLSKDDTWSKAFKSSESCKKLSG